MRISCRKLRRFLVRATRTPARGLREAKSLGGPVGEFLFVQIRRGISDGNYSTW
jgi:hypothetical protein